MKKILNPGRVEWGSICKRPTLPGNDVQKAVEDIFYDIKKNGDSAVKKYSNFFDGVTINDIRVSESDIEQAASIIPIDLKEAIEVARENITQFHAAQAERKKVIETVAGVECWRESRPIEKVGIYIPGGSAPLFSTVLMLGIPAIIAGCKQIILCSPPGKDGKINPAILYAASVVGITNIYTVGGIQAISAMCTGTGSIPKVDKIFGPGNQFVTAAKQYALNFGTAIDIPAGPSELLVIADSSANPEFVAADLLSQAEHGADSQVILLSDSQQMVDKVLIEIGNQTEVLSRKEIILKSLANSKAIVLHTIKECLELSNMYAPEHLILACEKYNDLIPAITNAGSVFLGNYSCESAGDYASGTNHTLPTNGYARNYSGVSLDSFIKKITFQEISNQGILNIGPSIEIMASAEQLDAHKNAVSIRLKSLRNE